MMLLFGFLQSFPIIPFKKFNLWLSKNGFPPSNIDFVVKSKSTETTWEQPCSEIQKPESKILGSDFNQQHNDKSLRCINRQTILSTFNVHHFFDPQTINNWDDLNMARPYSIREENHHGRGNGTAQQACHNIFTKYISNFNKMENNFLVMV